MASWNEKILLKLRGAEKWPWTDATVYDYVLDGPRGTRNTAYYRAELSYSFWIEGHIYSSIAVWDESDAGSNLYRKDDAIQIQYNPSDPNQSYFPEREEIGTIFYLTLIGTAVALAAIIWIGTNLFHR